MTKFDPKRMPGQMTVDDCIEVAEQDLDGVREKIVEAAEKAGVPREYLADMEPLSGQALRPLTAAEVVARRLRTSR